MLGAMTAITPYLRLPIRPPLSAASGWSLALVATTAVWGWTFVVVADAVDRLPVLAFLAYRFLAAGAMLAVPSLRGLRELGRDGWRLALVSGAVLWAGYAFQTFGLTQTSASKAGFITGLAVVITPLLAAAVRKHRVGRAVWGATAASAAGLALLTGVGGGLQPFGDGLVLLCAVAFSVHILLTDHAVRRVAVVPFITVQVLVCGTVSLALAGLLGQLQLPRDPSVWSALAVTAVLASVVGFLVQAGAQRRLPPARIALALACEPAFAGLFGYLLVGERLGAAGWAGAALMLAAVVAVEALPRSDVKTRQV